MGGRLALQPRRSGTTTTVGTALEPGQAAWGQSARVAHGVTRVRRICFTGCVSIAVRFRQRRSPSSEVSQACLTQNVVCKGKSIRVRHAAFLAHDEGEIGPQAHLIHWAVGRDRPVKFAIGSRAGKALAEGAINAPWPLAVETVISRMAGSTSLSPVRR